MKKHILFLLVVFATVCKSQDTVQVNTYKDAINLTFGQLPPAHYPSGILIDKVGIDKKMIYANGELNDSIFNSYEWYYYYSKIYFAQTDTIFLKKTFLQVDSIKNIYIDNNNILPIGVLNFNYQKFLDSAYYKKTIDVSNHSLFETTADLTKIYETKKLFSVCPLNTEVNTLNPQFVLLNQNIYSNDTSSISKMFIDLDDGLGFKEVFVNQSFQASYSSAGYKNITTKFICFNGDTLIANSQLYCNDPDFLNSFARTTETYDFIVDVLSWPDTWPTDEFGTVPYSFKKATFGVWQGCNNNEPNNIRKPIIIFGGYNPKKGKDLKDNGNGDWINDNFGPIVPLAGWRGPYYETYNGFYTDASNGPQHYGSNGSEFLNKLRSEGYDIIIVKMHDGIGYLQYWAHLVTQVIKKVNDMKSNGALLNPGADLDPEASGYPLSHTKRRSHHENIVIGYSAGALASRMGLLLMEYQHDKYKLTGDAWKYPHHNTKIWVGYDCENQGSNVPIGFQMFTNFEANSLPGGVTDIINMFMASKAGDVLKTNGIATQNTLYHILNTSYAGGQQWNTGHHSDFDDFFNDLTTISNPQSQYSKLKGYPIYCKRIGISPGNAYGIKNGLYGNSEILDYEQPHQWCAFLPSGINPYKHAKAFAIQNNSSSENAFYCKVGVAMTTFWYSWFIEYNHHIYKKNNYINNSQNYDVTAASTLPSHVILGKKLMSVGVDCIGKSYNHQLHGFCPTPSSLDIHEPWQTSLPRLPNLNLTPDNQNLLFQNDYSSLLEKASHKNFGYPHIKHPANHYDITPYDAVCANSDFDGTYYNYNTIHVEDPNPYTAEFLVEELAPTTLYLSSRTIHDEITGEKYYADFEARNSILAGNQDIYKHSGSIPDFWYQRLQTPPGDFVVENQAVVTMRANNGDGNSSVVLGPGFSAKHGSIFRAYVYGDAYCSPFTYTKRTANPQQNATNGQPAPRYMVAKRATQNKLKEPLQKWNVITYPNPTSGSVYYEIKTEEGFNYSINDLLGSELQAGTIDSGNNQINLSNFKPGIYLITIKNSNYTQTDRIILQ